ncbi:MAG: DNA translocase FtsK 4TM domain-containing protein, partial [Desulfobacterota bacterium]|nr:DNA translocase FtsK 4TM domain-containing protein [Thermodesulfobacteriota bacterium]
MRKHQKPSSLPSEIFSLVLFTFSLAISLSLVSYHPEDPSLSYYAHQPQKIQNLLGIIGSYLADFLYQVFGLGSFLLIIGIFHFSFKLFITLKFSFDFIRVLSFIGLLFAVDGLLNLAFDKVTFLNFSGNPGGLLGIIISDYLVRYLNRVGTNIFLALLLIVSLRLYGNFSFIFWVRNFIKSLLLWAKSVGSLFRLKGKIFSRSNKTNGKIKLLKEKEPKAPLLIDKEESPEPKKSPRIITPVVDEKISSDKPKLLPSSSLASGFMLPPLTLLNDPQKEVTQIEREVLIQNSRLLENKLNDFGVQATVINVHPGQVVTLYELEPAPGVKINRIVNLADDLALGLKAMGIRIIAPLPGKGAIGVEIPNKHREVVFFKEIVGQEKFLQNESPLTLGMGKDIYGMPIIADLAQMPHLLIAGTTGSGKSVFLNSLICSILYKAIPTEVKLLIIDPKRSELTLYEEIPHLIYPVVTD